MTLETLEGETWEALRARVWRPIYDVTAPSINILVWKTIWASVRDPIHSSVNIAVFNKIYSRAISIIESYDT